MEACGRRAVRKYERSDAAPGPFRWLALVDRDGGGQPDTAAPRYGWLAVLSQPSKGLVTAQVPPGIVVEAGGAVWS